MTIIEIMKEYGTNKLCLELLEQIRWGHSVYCPYYGSKKTSVKTEKRTK